MNSEKRDYPNGTFIKTRGMWNVFHSAKAICPDGKARVVSRIAPVSDTYFTIPAGMRIKGKYYSGYIYFSEEAETRGAVMFSAYTEGNKKILSEK